MSTEYKQQGTQTIKTPSVMMKRITIENRGDSGVPCKTLSVWVALLERNLHFNFSWLTASQR